MMRDAGDGFEAGKRGEPRSANPHRPGYAEFKAWKRGWIEARYYRDVHHPEDELEAIRASAPGPDPVLEILGLEEDDFTVARHYGDVSHLEKPDPVAEIFAEVDHELALELMGNLPDVVRALEDGFRAIGEVLGRTASEVSKMAAKILEAYDVPAHLVFGQPGPKGIIGSFPVTVPTLDEISRKPLERTAFDLKLPPIPYDPALVDVRPPDLEEIVRKMDRARIPQGIPTVRLDHWKTIRP